MFTKLLGIIFAVLMMVVESSAIEIDLSRRQNDLNRLPVSTYTGRQPASEKVDVKQVIAASSATNEIVILNTSKGFVPATINLQVGKRYHFHVVNIIKEKKNVSFVMPMHRQNHSTFFGELTEFSLEPKAEGIFSFECPETAAEGRVVVLPLMKRDLASELMDAPETAEE